MINFKSKAEKYYADIYCNFWKNQVKVYGKDNYTQFIINTILSKNPNNVFELAIGTGWPIASALSENGLNISGCDISPKLIKQVKHNYPNFKVYVCKDGKLKKEINKYDLVYCVRASWYFDNFISQIYKMTDMAKNNGTVIFDIMNEKSPSYFMYLLKFYLSPKSIKNRLVNWFYRVPISPVSKAYDPYKINKILKGKNIRFKIYSEDQITKGRGYKGNFNPKSMKLIYVLEL